MNVLLLKEIISNYTTNKISPMATFIDLIKAFDRMDHFILGKKMLSSGLPVDIIFMLMHYLRNQQANVNWHDTSSPYHYVETEVRQGGVLSPFLFNFYINEIIDDISNLEEHHGLCR